MSRTGPKHGSRISETPGKAPKRKIFFIDVKEGSGGGRGGLQPRYNLDEARVGRRAPLAAPAAPSRQEQPPLLPRRLPAGDAAGADAGARARHQLSLHKMFQTPCTLGFTLDLC